MTRPTVLAYYFPNWHRDPRNEARYGADWTEWELLKAATERFPGHRQPRTPALGYRDESDRAIADEEIDLALDHGVDGFLFDYYWYEGGPYLSGALDNGFLAADGSERMKFALMWANHQWIDHFPNRHPDGTIPSQLFNGALNRTEFETMALYVVEHYFSRENYLKLDGAPWFTLYDIGNFVTGLGGIGTAREALDWFRALAVEAGHPGLHLDAVLWSAAVIESGNEEPIDAVDTFRRLGFDSGTSYVWIHHYDATTSSFPAGSVAELRTAAFKEYERYAEQLDVPFYPNVTTGWDPSPRTDQSVPYVHSAYPWTPIWDQDPAEFRTGVEQAVEFLRRHRPRQPIITVNAWNEWTEGSYLLPDTDHGLAFLEAIRDTVGPR